MPALTKRSIIVLSIGAIILFAALLVVYYAYLSPTGWKAQQNATLSKIDVGDNAEYTTLDGEVVDLGDLDGKILIINVWASWSPYTPEEHRILEDLGKTYGDRLRIVALDRMEDPSTANAYLNEVGKREGIEYVLDAHDDFFKTVGGYAMPETILFDRVGNVHFHKRGTLNIEEMSIKIDELL